MNEIKKDFDVLLFCYMRMRYVLVLLVLLSIRGQETVSGSDKAIPPVDEKANIENKN